MKSSNPSKEQLEVFLTKMYLDEKLKEDFEINSDPAALNYKSKLMKITPKLFFQYLDNKGVPLMCTLCHKGALAVSTSTILQTEAPPDMQKRYQERAFDIAALLDTSYVSYCVDNSASDLWGLRRSCYHAHCQWCGHLEVFQTRPVIEWYENLARETTHDEG